MVDLTVLYSAGISQGQISIRTIRMVSSAIPLNRLSIYMHNYVASNTYAKRIDP